jgi:hypothetical protein
MKRRATALIGAVMFGGLSAGAACSSGGGQTAHGGSGGQPQGGVGGTAGSIGGGIGGNTGGGGGAGGGGGLACAATALTNCTGTMSGAWCVDQFLLGDPVEAQFNGIWATGPTDVWAVGSHADAIGIMNSAGFIFHWDGCAWTQTPLAIAAGLAALWGSSANDVWAVGYQGTALHWNGSVWTPVSTGTTTATLWSVSGTAANDVWAVGNEGAFHWNGTAWSASPGFPIPPPETNFDGDVWAVAPNDVWVVGNRNLLTRFNGTTWSTTPVSTNVTHSLFGIWSDGSTAVAVGEGDQIHKFAGGAWTMIQGSGGSSIGFLDVMAIGADVWAVGQSVVHSVGGGPFQPDPDAAAQPYALFEGLWMTATQVWAAGSGQPNDKPTIIHRAR